MDDPVLLARVQFGLTIMFHFLFPPITMGLSLLIAVLEGLRWRTKQDLYRRASDFWLKVFAATFAVGVATGIVMEFQFGTNWAGYSRFVGDVFGAPLAVEALVAFFLESGFLGLLLFGRTRVSSFLRLFASVMVWLGSTLSGFWILVANSWMQTPAGYHIRDGRAEMTDFVDAVLNPSTFPRFFHTIASAWVMGAFLMAGVAAYWHLRGSRGGEVRRADAPCSGGCGGRSAPAEYRGDVAGLSLRMGVVAGLLSTLAIFVTGDHHAKQVARTQPCKFAAMEGLYDTTSGAPLVLFALPPSQTGPAEGPEITVTKFLSFMAFGNFQAPVKGLREFPPEDWPPVAITFLAFHNMVVVGNLIGLVSLVSAFLLWRRRLEEARWWQRAMVLSIPLPMIAIQLGWITAEVGRQPWVVYGVLRTRDAVSKVVSAEEVLFSIAVFGVIYLLLGLVWLRVLATEIQHGPQGPEGAHA